MRIILFLFVGLHSCFLGAYADNFHIVESGRLYRSAQLTGQELSQYIKRYQIKTIINLRGKSNQKWWQDEQRVAQKNKIDLINIPMSSSKFPTKEHLKMLLDVYATGKYPMLIHCMSGINRTGEAAAVWILDQQHASKKEALKQLDQKFGYDKQAFPKKVEFIEMWQGREWALTLYDQEKAK